MGHLTIQGVDDDLVERYRLKAAQSGKSLDECLREVLERAAPPSPAERVAAGRRIRAMTPDGIAQTDSAILIREDRDSR